MAAAGSRPKTPLSQTWSPCRAVATGALGRGFGMSRKWPQWEDAQQHLAPSELGSPPGTLPAFCPPCRGQVPWNWEDCSFYNCERSFVPTAAPVVAWKRAAVGICGTSAASRRRCSANGLGSRKLAALASLFFGVPLISGPRQLFTAWLAMHTLWMLGNASCWQLGNALALHP